MVPFFGSDSSLGKGAPCIFGTVPTDRHGFGSCEIVPMVPVPLSVPGNVVLFGSWKLGSWRLGSDGSHSQFRFDSWATLNISRPDPCSVDFGPDAPKFRFENCCGFLGGFFLLIFFQVKRPEKVHQKIPRRIHPGLCSDKFPSDFCRILCLRISHHDLSIVWVFQNRYTRSWLSR